MALKDQYLKNTNEFVKLIKNFPDDYFNIKPDAESWSAADVLEHVYRSEVAIPRLFNGKTTILTDRKPDAYLSEMQHLFLKSSAKMKSFGIINPTEGEKAKDELIAKFRNNRLVIAELIQEQNLNELCLHFEHPLFGHLTRLEWVHFNMMHVERHKRQIERIKDHHKIKQ